MALLKVSKENGVKITPKLIKERLFYFSDAAEHFHLETKSYAEHKALDILYSGVNEFKDDILEKLMGYIGGDRIGAVKIADMPEYSEKEVKILISEIEEFSYSLYEWAGDKKYCDIENKAQELSGLSSKVAYLLTLK